MQQRQTDAYTRQKTIIYAFLFSFLTNCLKMRMLSNAFAIIGVLGVISQLPYRKIKFTLIESEASLALQARIYPEKYKELALVLLDDKQYSAAWHAFNNIPSDNTDKEQALFHLFFDMLLTTPNNQILKMLQQQLKLTAQDFYAEGLRQRNAGDFKSAYVHFCTSIKMNSNILKGFLSETAQARTAKQTLLAKANYNAGYALYKLVKQDQLTPESNYLYLEVASRQMRKAIDHKTTATVARKALHNITQTMQQLHLEPTEQSSQDEIVSPEVHALLNQLRLGEEYFGVGSAPAMQQMLRDQLQNDPQSVANMLEALGTPVNTLKTTLQNLQSTIGTSPR